MESSNRSSLGALQMTRVPRSLLALLAALALAAAASVVVFRPWMEVDLLLAALVVCGLVSAALAIVGRLPSGFQVAGMHVDFTVDKLSDLLNTIDGVQGIEKDARDKIHDLIRQAADPKSFEEASKLSGKFREPTEPPVSTASGRAVQTDRHDSPRERVEAVLAGVARGPLGRDLEVDGSGRGKKPKFNYLFTADGPSKSRIQVVAQVEQYWNPSNVDLLRRKVTRALLKSTPVSRAVIVVPRRGQSAVVAEIDELPDALVMAQEEFDDAARAKSTLIDWLSSPSARERRDNLAVRRDCCRLSQLNFFRPGE